MEIDKDPHERMIHAFQEYFKWQTKFQYKGSDEAGIKARYWLNEIRDAVNDRKKEIQVIRAQRKAARNEQRIQAEKAT